MKIARNLIENETLRKPNERNFFIPKTQLSNSSLIQSNPVSNKLQSAVDGDFANLFSKSILDPCAPPWNHPMESLQKVTKSEPVAMLAPQSLPSHESDDGGADFLQTMKKLAVAAMLPKSELTVFDGNPLKYFIFIRTFENNVEKDTDDYSRRLQLLIQFCSCKAKRVIESCNPIRARIRLLESEENAWREIW